MYCLINAQKCSMTEFKTNVTLDEMLKMYALYQMEIDVNYGRV